MTTPKPKPTPSAADVLDAATAAAKAKTDKAAKAKEAKATKAKELKERKTAEAHESNKLREAAALEELQANEVGGQLEADKVENARIAEEAKAKELEDAAADKAFDRAGSMDPMFVDRGDFVRYFLPLSDGSDRAIEAKVERVHATIVGGVGPVIDVSFESKAGPQLREDVAHVPCDAHLLNRINRWELLPPAPEELEE